MALDPANAGIRAANAVKNGEIGPTTADKVSNTVVYIGLGAVLGIVGGYFLKLGTWKPALLGGVMGFAFKAIKSRPTNARLAAPSEKELAQSEFAGMANRKRIKNRYGFRR